MYVYMYVISYELSSRGELQITLEQHLLLPDTAPRSIGFEELVQSIQRSIPFENFDPDGVTATTTVRTHGENLLNGSVLVNIMVVT
jgi:hypothetical protein